jgi:CheY-like chemotaxis protein
MGISSQTGSTKILVIGANNDLLDLYRERFDRLGNWKVVGVSSGDEALEILDGSFDLIIQDWDIPEKTPRKLITALKTDQPNIPIVTISSEEYPMQMDSVPILDNLLQPVTQEEWKMVLEDHGLID